MHRFFGYARGWVFARRVGWVALVVFGAILPLHGFVWAQPETSASEPKTKLEAFLSRKGMIIVKVYHALGFVKGEFGGAEITAVVLYEPGKEAEKVRGVRIEVRTASVAGSDSAFLDMEEIDSLIKGVEYIDKALSQWAESETDYVEVIYRSRGDLSLGFYVKESKRSAFIKCGSVGSSTVFLKPEKLAEVRTKLTEGLTYLQGK